MAKENNKGTDLTSLVRKYQANMKKEQQDTEDTEINTKPILITRFSEDRKPNFNIIDVRGCPLPPGMKTREIEACRIKDNHKKK